MKLNEYLKINQIRQSSFAKAVGVSQGFVSAVIIGRYVPKGRNAIEWSKATGWAVTPHELNPHDYPNPTDGLPVEFQANTQPEAELIHENQA
ncbi:helix-turn-helix domain-containing protein [Escherichia coli]|uniref:helix-turn-helix domain-containing protein n=1 Tax=Escherichia coli TaxID=562 RepID=UPI001F1024B1|nr:helix-turn-helix domain-containing protein [Escherichia coli]UMR99295.1 transcriptional regulator [Escherichia coli]